MGGSLYIEGVGVWGRGDLNRGGGVGELVLSKLT